MKHILTKLFRYLAIFLVILVTIGFMSLEVFANNNYENRNGYTVEHIKEMLENEDTLNDEDNYITVYEQDGTMLDVQLENIDELNSKDISQFRTSNSFDVQKIVDSGKSDEDSIVITIMGDGFTESEQSAFINAAQNSANSLINQYPMSLYKDYFNIYAVKVISNESGVSRDVDNFHWLNNNPTVDNYLGSTYWYDGNMFNHGTERMLYIKNTFRAKALERDGSVLTVIICNSTRWGGSASICSFFPIFWL